MGNFIFGNDTMTARFRDTDGMLLSMESKLGNTQFYNHIWAVNCGSSIYTPEMMDSFSAVQTEDALQLLWKKGADTVTVVLTKGDKIRWRIFVNLSEAIF